MSTIEKAAAKLVKKADHQTATEDASGVASVQPLAPADTNSHPVEIAVSDGTGQQSSPREHRCELDLEWLNENGFLVPKHTNPGPAHEFRRIKRALLQRERATSKEPGAIPANLIFVTSALPSEGKTFVSLNLALSLSSELDRNVLLVDGDAAKRDLSRWLGVNGQRGLTDCLRDKQTSFDHALFETNVNRLSVLPSGEYCDHLDELYASQLMEQALRDLARDKNSVIIVDGPPLLATTEASVLARNMGQIALVIESNRTPKNAVQTALSQLDGCQNVGLLLNKARAAPVGGSYGYGYGKQYGYGYGHGEATGDHPSIRPVSSQPSAEAPAEHVSSS